MTVSLKLFVRCFSCLLASCNLNFFRRLETFKLQVQTPKWTVLLPTGKACTVARLCYRFSL